MEEFVDNTASRWFLLFGRIKTVVACQIFADLKMPSMPGSCSVISDVKSNLVFENDIK